MTSSYEAVLTDFCFGRLDQKWGRFGLGPFSMGAVMTGNPEIAIVVTRDFVE